MSKFKERATDAIWLVIAAAIVAAGVFGFRLMGVLKEPVAARTAERVVPHVDVVQPVKFGKPLPIRGEGFLQPFRQVDLASETSGRVVVLHPAIEDYGAFEVGDILVRLNQRAAKANLSRTEADIASTMARLELNKIRLRRAQTLINRNVISQDRLDELNAENAELESALQSLRAARDRAQVDLENTEILAPFAGRVLSRSVEIGDIASPGEALATIYTDDRLEATIPVTEEDAALIPALFEGGKALAVVRSRFAGKDVEWDAHVSRVDPGLDPQTRTVDITVEIAGRRSQEEAAGDFASGTPPALINAFVNVTIDGAQLADIFAVPSTAIREGGFLWMAQDERLSIIPVDIIHVDGPTSFVRLDELSTDALLITSGLDAPVEGMALRLMVHDGAATVLAD